MKLRTSLGLVAGAPPARARGAAMTEESKKDGEGLQGMELLAGDQVTVVPNRDARSATGECLDCHIIVASSQLAAHQGSKKCMEEAEKRRSLEARENWPKIYMEDEDALFGTSGGGAHTIL